MVQVCKLELAYKLGRDDILGLAYKLERDDILELVCVREHGKKLLGVEERLYELVHAHVLLWHGWQSPHYQQQRGQSKGQSTNTKNENDRD